MVATDEYWIRLSVPVHNLRWLMTDSGDVMEGGDARIIMDNGRGEREGYLLRQIGTLNEGSRLAGMIVAVSDPLLMWRAPGEDENAMPLILGDYVKVILEGRDIENAARLPLSWLRDDNTVWIKSGQTLQITPVHVVYEDRNYAYISDELEDGHMIITSNIPVPVAGMKIRTMAEARSAVQERMKGPKGPEADE